MKFLSTLFFYSIVLSLTFISCKEDGDEPTVKSQLPFTVVSSVLPKANTTNQSVFTNPIIIFSYGVEQVVQFPPYTANSPSNYKLILDEAKLLTPAEIEATIDWSASKDSLFIIPKTVLSPQITYTVYIKTHWEKENQNGSWEPIASSNGAEFQISENTFTTQNIDISKILPGSIQFNYPIANQFNFLKSEYSQGYMKLNAFQNYLFESSSGGIQYLFKARFTSPGKSNIEVPLTFDQSTTTLTHDIPSNLFNETIYKLQYLKIPTGGGTEQELYAIHFRTSKHNTFIEKIDSYTRSNPLVWSTSNGGAEFSLKLLDNTEYFDFMEARVDSVDGGSRKIYFSTGLIQFEALAGNTWYDEKIYPLLYENLSTSGLVWKRTNANLKMPPVNAVYLRRAANYESNFISFRKLTQAEIDNNQTTSMTDQATLVYNMGPATAQDYLYFRALAANSNSTSTYVQNLLSKDFPNVTAGTYQVKIKYVLPGKTTPSSEKTISFSFAF